MPTIHTVIGLKRLAGAKERLIPHLHPVERRELMLRMLRSVVREAQLARLGPVLLATSEPTAPKIAGELGVRLVSDGDRPWNDGLVYAVRQVAPAPAAVLYLAGDLPLVTADDLRQFAVTAPASGVAIGRARDGGTNALLVRPPHLMPPLFGHPHSSKAHAEQARLLALEWRVVDIAGIALDVDTIEDARDAHARLRERDAAIEEHQPVPPA